MSAGPTWLTPTPVGSIIVAGLQSPSSYISTFVVEIYGDSGLTQLIDQQTTSAFWDGTNSNQVDVLVFSALPLGFTYWIRVGTCSAHSTITSWTVPYEQSLTGNTGLDAITYGGTYTGTSSGVSYLVRPSSAPSDIDHYEAIYTVNNAASPATTATPSWRGVTDASGLLTFGAVGAPNQVVRAYVRGVNTSGMYQSWILISTLSVTSAAAGNLDQLSDGTTYARMLAAGLTSGSPDPRKTAGILKLGSLNPAWSGSMYWSATAGSVANTSSVSFWFDQLVVKRIDGTQTVIGARTQANAFIVSSLNASISGTTIVYDFYPYIDDINNIVSFLSTGLGSPPYAWLDSALTEDSATTNSQLMNRQDRIGLGPIQVSMPIYAGGGGGTSGGGGGYGGTCPRGDMLVRLACGSIIRADQILPGDRLVTTLEYGLTVKVHSVRHEPHSEWIEIHTTKGSVVVHPHTHLPVEDQDDCVQAKDLTLSHILKSRRGSARITNIDLLEGEGTRVILSCDKAKVFLCGWDAPDLVIHNLRLPNC